MCDIFVTWKNSSNQLIEILVSVIIWFFFFFVKIIGFTKFYCRFLTNWFEWLQFFMLCHIQITGKEWKCNFLYSSFEKNTTKVQSVTVINIYIYGGLFYTWANIDLFNLECGYIFSFNINFIR